MLRNGKDRETERLSGDALRNVRNVKIQKSQTKNTFQWIQGSRKALQSARFKDRGTFYCLK